MRVIIIGAGLGGLTAAFCFARLGHDVIILEKRASLTAQQGGGIIIRAGATRVLHSWGLESKMAAISDHTPTSLLRNLETGEVAQRSILVDVSDFPEWATSRQSMIELMHREARAAGADIRIGCRVADVQDSQDQATVILEDNTKLEADIILAADGIHSRTRSKVLEGVQGLIDPIVSKSTLYGIQVSAAELLADPEARTLTEDSHQNLNVWMGSKGYVVGKYSASQKMWSSLFGIKSDTSAGEGFWSEHADIDHVRTSFAGACPPLSAVLVRLAKSCSRWKLAEMPDLARWTSTNGRILLLGDSAHAMHPNAAQGFSQIVEDIGVLNFLLSSVNNHRHSGPSKAVPQMTQIWQHLRKPRVERIKAYAKWNTRLYEGEPLVAKDGDGQNKIKSLKTTKPDRDASFHSSAFMKWCLDHDSVAEAKHFLNATKARLRFSRPYFRGFRLRTTKY